MSKVSDARSFRVGLVGPKPRARAVGDGQSVDIPIPPEIVCTARCLARGRWCAEATSVVEAASEKRAWEQGRDRER